MQAEVIHFFDSKVLKDILFIERNSFPEAWCYGEETEEYYSRMLGSKDNINIILADNDKRIGYLLAMPHNKAVHELKDADPSMKEDPGRYYIETVGILPEFRGRRGFPLMLGELIEECKKRGFDKMSLHARVCSGLSSWIQRFFKVTELRRIDRWKYYNYEEPADYIEVAL